MVNWWLIIVSIVVVVLTVAITTYLLVIFSSPDDAHGAWLPKIVVVVSFCLAVLTVLLLPFDVANRADPLLLGSLGGGLDLVLVWHIGLIAIIADVLLVIPFCIFYYEAMDPDHKCGGLSQIPAAIGYALLFLIMFLVILLAMWFSIGFTDIPYTAYTAVALPEEATDAYQAEGLGCHSYPDQILKVRVSLFVYAIALFTLAGWVLLAVFGGIGLSALPVDMILSWVERPRPITLGQYGDKKRRIAAAAERLTLKGKLIQDEQQSQGNRISVGLIKRINKFKLEVTFVEERLRRLEIAHKLRGGSIWIPWASLFGGIISVCLSLMWVAHLLAFNILHKHQLLNFVFIALDGVFPLFGTVAYAVFTFYLLAAVVKGVTRVGMRLPFFEIHPMKLRDTLMNAFLFNCALVLVSTVALVHFAAQSFQPYAENTAVESLFTTYVENLLYIGVIFRYIQYALLVCFFLGLLFTCLSRPHTPQFEI